MKKTLMALSFVAILAGCQSTNTSTTNSSPEPTKVTTAETSTSTESANTTKTFTLSDVEKHAVKTDCWMIVNNKVYDVTKGIDAHPGGPAIINGCGKDSTNLFTEKHKGKTKPSENLNNFYIGDLAK